MSEWVNEWVNEWVMGGAKSAGDCGGKSMEPTSNKFNPFSNSPDFSISNFQFLISNPYHPKNICFSAAQSNPFRFLSGSSADKASAKSQVVP